MQGIFFFKQKCIPVGCVPAARRPSAGVCFPGASAWSRGGGQGGVCLVRGVCVWSQGECVWSQGVCLARGGLPGPGGVVGVSGPGGHPSMHWGRHPSPPVEDTSLFVQSLIPLFLDFWWHLPWVSKPGWIPSLACFVTCMQLNLQIRL